MKKFIIIISIIFITGISYSGETQKHNPLHPGTDEVFSGLFNAALDFKDSGRDDAFLAKMEEAYNRAVKINADLSAAISLYYMGCMYLSLNRVRDAMESLNRLKEIASAANNTGEPEYWLYALLAEVSIPDGKYRDALDYSSKAVAGIEKAYGAYNRFTIELYLSLAVSCYYNDNLEKFIQYNRLALKYAEAVYPGGHPFIAEAYNNLGAAADSMGDYSGAIGFYNKSLEAKIKIYGAGHRSVATAYNNLGLAFHNRGEYEKAIIYLQKALEIRLKVLGGQHPDLASSYDNLGFSYWYAGDYDRAVVFFEKALAGYKSNFGEIHPHVALAYNNLGAVYSARGDYEKAFDSFDKALKIDIQAYGETHSAVAIDYNNLGTACWNTGDFDGAIRYHEKALKIYYSVSGENSPGVARSYNNLGSTCAYKGDHSAAIKYFEKALKVDLVIFGENHPDTATTLNNLGGSYFGLHDYARAMEYFGKALKITSMTGANQKTVLFSMNLGQACVEVKKYRQALTSYLAGIERIEKVRRLNLAGGTDFTSRNIDAYYCAATACYMAGDMEPLFNISERMRAMGYLERLSLNAAIDAAGIDPEKGKKLLQLKDDIERLSDLRQKIVSSDLYKMNDKQKADHERQLEDNSRHLEQAEAEFNRLDTGFMKNEKYKMLRDSSVVSVKRAQEMCGKDGAVIEYIIPAKTGPYMKPCALVITSSSINAVELDSSYNFSGQIEKYRTAIKENRIADIDSIGVELHAKLIAPVEGYINSANIKKLIIVPDGSLAFLPFDSLKTKDGKYLSDRYELNLAPSVTVSCMVKDRKYDKRENLMAFGGGIYSSKGENSTRGKSSFRGIEIELDDKEKLAAKAYNTPLEYYTAQQISWSDLPGTEREVSAINEKIYNKKNTEIYTGEKASEDNLKSLSRSGKLKKYSSIHLACHGYYDPEYPSYSAVVFSEVSGKIKESRDDGYMSVEETALLNLQSEIVVLSACETGLGRMVNGDGVIGLTRAFQVAGSNRVLATLWPVSDETTEQFMVSFYAKIKAGMDYSEALVKVKEEFRRSDKFSAPYFWAGYVLYE